MFTIQSGSAAPTYAHIATAVSMFFDYYRRAMSGGR